GREESGLAAFGGDGVDVQPAIALPGEYDAAAGRPEQLTSRVPGPKGAAHTGLGAPDFAAFAGCDVYRSDGPGLGGAAGAERERVLRSRFADEGELSAIRRPGGGAVAIDRGIGEGQSP